MKRVFLIVLDSVGAGALPDAGLFGDEGAFTLGTLRETGILNIPNLIAMGLGNIDGLGILGSTASPTAAHARLAERSMGKDTTTGHWEIAGIVSEKPLPTYPSGFPSNVISEFSRRTKRGVLCNKPYSGTDVIRDYGEEHLRTGDLIVYTSADSVFQIAAHEDVVPLEELYEYCRIAREMLVGEHNVGRVIARPFTGKVGSFTRTANRRDFSLEPTGRTILDAVSGAGLDVISVGKISDIFAGRGVTESHPTHGNAEGMETALRISERRFSGLCFVNLVDFDMLYGHRNDALGYAEALNEFDAFLPSLVSRLEKDDVLMITADHGCDPGYKGTDHTREYIPLLVLGEGILPVNMGSICGFSGIGGTVCELLGVSFPEARGFAAEIRRGEDGIKM